MNANDRLPVGDWDIAINGEKLANHFTVRQVLFPALPDITLNDIQVNGKPGSWFASREIGTRVITVKLGIFSATRERVEAMENWIHNAYILTSDKECRLDLGRGHYVNAVMNGSSQIEKNGYWTTTDITFTCFDPFIYGANYSIPLSNGENKITVSGTYKTMPVFEINTHSDSFELSNQNGKKVKVDNAGTTVPIIIDMKNYRCTQGGEYKAADPTVSDFWGLVPGENKITLKTGSGTLKYTEVFL